MLNGAGLRWSPASATWWRAKVTGGAASPLWCDACAARIDAEEKAVEETRRTSRGDRFDMHLEDTMRNACGL